MSHHAKKTKALITASLILLCVNSQSAMADACLDAINDSTDRAEALNKKMFKRQLQGNVGDAPEDRKMLVEAMKMLLDPMGPANECVKIGEQQKPAYEQYLAAKADQKAGQYSRAAARFTTAIGMYESIARDATGDTQLRNAYVDHYRLLADHLNTDNSKLKATISAGEKARSGRLADIAKAAEPDYPVIVYIAARRKLAPIAAELALLHIANDDIDSAFDRYHEGVTNYAFTSVSSDYDKLQETTTLLEDFIKFCDENSCTQEIGQLLTEAHDAAMTNPADLRELKAAQYTLGAYYFLTGKEDEGKSLLKQVSFVGS